MTIDTNILKKAQKLYIVDLAINKEIAAQNGSHSDGGYQDGIIKLNYFLDGVSGNIPAFLDKYYNQAINEQDPDYNQYIKLKQKFEPKS